MLNLYFPDHWMEKAQRDVELAFFRLQLHYEPIPSSLIGYLTGVNEVDAQAYGWSCALAWFNMGLPLQVPGWVYTHQYGSSKGSYEL